MPTVYIKYVRLLVYQTDLSEAVQIIEENISGHRPDDQRLLQHSLLLTVHVCSILGGS